MRVNSLEEMKILYIAYSCDPMMGSEDSIGWNIPFEMSKNHNVIVVTKSEHEEVITHFKETHKIDNMLFYYVDIPQIYKKVYKGFFYSGRLAVWNRKAFSLVKRICKETKIDIIHQITPTEFRAAGSYGKIEGVKFICGPLGGGEYIPKGLIPYSRSHFVVEVIRRIENNISCIMFTLNRRLRKCDSLMVANCETRRTLVDSDKRLSAESIRIVPDVGIGTQQIKKEDEVSIKHNNRIKIITVGRLIYRKGQMLLLDALDRLPKDAQYECLIIGGGPDLNQLRKRVDESGELSKHVVVTGRLPEDDLNQAFQEADVFVLSSIREATGGVVLEALSKGVPVVAQKRFGAMQVMTEDCGWFFDGATKDEFINNLKGIISDCIQNPDMVLTKKINAIRTARKYTWDKKCFMYESIYKDVLSSDIRTMAQE